MAVMDRIFGLFSPNIQINYSKFKECDYLIGFIYTFFLLKLSGVL